MQTERVCALERVRRVAKGNAPVDIAVADREVACEFT